MASQKAARAWKNVHPSVRIAMLVMLSACVFCISGAKGLAVIAYAVVCAVALICPHPAKVGKLMLPAVPFVIMAVVFGMLSYEAAAGMVVSLDSLGNSLLTGGRLLLLFAASAFFCTTSTSEEQMVGLRVLLAPLGKLGVRVDDVATTLSLALRFIPLTLETLSRIRTAHASRGSQLAGGSVAARLKANAATFAPLFVTMFRRADVIAAAMDARCYGFAPVRTNLNQPRLNGVSVGALVLTAAICGIGLAL